MSLAVYGLGAAGLSPTDFAWTFEDVNFKNKNNRPSAMSLPNGGNDQKLWVITEVGGRVTEAGAKYGESSLAGLAYSEYDQDGLTNAYAELTIMFWFVKHGHTNSQQLVHRTSAMTTTNLGTFVIEINSGMQPSMAFADAERVPHRVMAGYKAPANEWVHIAMTFDKGAVAWYLNGNKKSTTKIPPQEIPGCLSKSRLVLSPQYSNNLDEFALFNRVLSQSEIAEIAEQGLAVVAGGRQPPRGGGTVPKMPPRPTMPARPKM